MKGICIVVPLLEAAIHGLPDIEVKLRVQGSNLL